MARLAIRMPKMSMTMTEGEVSSWRVEVGATVEVGDVVAEVMTDKVDMEVESTVAGELVEIVHANGIVAVGEPIGWVEGEDGEGGFGDLLAAPATAPKAESSGTDEPGSAPVPDADPEPADPAAEHTEEPSQAPSAPGPVSAVPRARALAREHGVDLAAVSGTGTDGLVLVNDVEALLASPPEPVPATVGAMPRHATPAGHDRRTAVRMAVARAMTPSAAIPQFTVWRVVDLDAADAVRHGVSWTTVLLRAYAGALREVPELLSRWEDDAPTEAGPPAIALAVATDRGLLVPRFVEPDRGQASDVDAEIRVVVESAHTGKLDPAYMGVANGSLSNLGGMGVDRFQALLTPPQASVLAVGSIRPRPVSVPGGVGLALSVELGLTVDHRVADGAHAAELLERLARRLGGSL